jgi:hypothetical protein
MINELPGYLEYLKNRFIIEEQETDLQAQFFSKLIFLKQRKIMYRSEWRGLPNLILKKI